jgi:antirestriction protein ArdC
VRKGEKASQVVFWKQVDGTATDPNTGETKSEKHLIARGYWVFNIAQVDGYMPKVKAQPELPLEPAGERIAHAERFFDALGFEIRHGGNQAYCSRATHHIQLPHFDQFHTPADYYSTRGHESVHRSGHDDMLNREFGKRFGDMAYAAEELVAELGAAFICGHLGISNEPRPDHAQYLASWLKVLKSDSRAIFTAASKAQAAADCLVALGGDLSGEASGEAVIRGSVSPASDEEAGEAIQLAA